MSFADFTRIIPMKSTLRFTFASLALAAGVASSAGAQALATFGSLETAGLGEGSALLGTSLSAGRQGLHPVATLIAQTYRYTSGFVGGTRTHDQAYALSPSLGLQYTTATGAVQASLGYTFVNTDKSSVLQTIQPIVGVETGTRNSTFISAQANYWGNGENTAQAITSYSFVSEYIWSRLRAAHRLVPTTPLYVGAEVVGQGTSKYSPSAYRYQVGPTIEYRFTDHVRGGASAGYRGGNNNAAGTGYARLEFLLLTSLANR